MTREEAIEELKILKEEYWDDDGYGHETKQYDDTMFALEMAIEALEQEPCDDAVSRKAVMDCFKKWQPYMATRLWDFEQELSNLSTVTPQEPRWIPVNERLPKEPYVGKIYRDPSESVLVQLSSGGIKVSRYWSHMNSIHTNLNNWIDLYSFEEVVAWMPLPKPYKAESEGNNGD